MQHTGGTRSTLRIAALVTVAAALVTGGVAAARLVTPPAAPLPAPTVGPGGSATFLAALPDRIGASNRAW